MLVRVLAMGLASAQAEEQARSAWMGVPSTSAAWAGTSETLRATKKQKVKRDLTPA